MQDLIAKATTLLEALPYIQRFRGATFVVKYGGSFMDSPDAAARRAVARDIVFLAAVQIHPVVVHGGGKAITRAMESAGLKPAFIQGQRVTDEATVKVVDRVLSGEINPEIVQAISSLGGKARGFAGTDIFTCRKMMLTGPERAPIDAGYVGEVVRVNTAPLRECIAAGVTPVISPVARGEDGRIYNCNADVAAAGSSEAPGDRRSRDDSEGGERGGGHQSGCGQSFTGGRTSPARGAFGNIHRRGRGHGGGVVSRACRHVGWTRRPPPPLRRSPIRTHKL